MRDEKEGSTEKSLREIAVQVLSSAGRMRISDLEKDTIKVSNVAESSVHLAIRNLDVHYPRNVYKSRDGQIVYVSDNVQREKAIAEEAASLSSQLENSKDFKVRAESSESDEMEPLIRELGRETRYFALPLDDRLDISESLSIVKTDHSERETVVFSFLSGPEVFRQAEVQEIKREVDGNEDLTAGLRFLRSFLPNLKDQICKYADNQITTIDQTITTGLIADITNQFSLIGIVEISIISIVLLILLKQD